MLLDIFNYKPLKAMLNYVNKLLKSEYFSTCFIFFSPYLTDINSKGNSIYRISVRNATRHTVQKSTDDNVLKRFLAETLLGQFVSNPLQFICYLLLKTHIFSSVFILYPNELRPSNL